MPTKVFWLKETKRVKVWLRRYRSQCPKGKKGETCEAELVLYESAPAHLWGRYGHAKDADRKVWHTFDSKIRKNDRMWSLMRCERCGGKFDRTDAKQLWAEHLYRGAPDGKLHTHRDPPAGAMWDAWWMPRKRPWVGPDGITLMVQLPNLWTWHVDGPCSNCTLPNDREHYCWTRKGDPRTGNVDVGKHYGRTCSAGAGSIQAGNYHGFLRDGYLTDG